MSVDNPLHLDDDDIETTENDRPMASETMPADPDSQDADGTDGDTTDGTDGDATDGTDGDATDADGQDL